MRYGIERWHDRRLDWVVWQFYPTREERDAALRRLRAEVEEWEGESNPEWKYRELDQERLEGM